MFLKPVLSSIFMERQDDSFGYKPDGKITDEVFNAVSGQREREGIKPGFEASYSMFS